MQGAQARAALAAILFAIVSSALSVHGEGVPEYRLGVGDQVQLSVLQQPNLDRALIVRPDGSLIVPLVGAVSVVGLTIREAEDLVRQRLRLFNREIGDVSLTVTQYNALRVSVLGAVIRPGEYTFQTPPSLWDAVRAAGGSSGAANLGAVRVVRNEGGQERAEFHDISALLTGQGSVDPVLLRAGDSVVVPTREETSATPTANTVQVLGAVLHPGSVSLTEPASLVSVVLLAGGPVEASNLSGVWWVRPGTGTQNRATKVDMNAFFRRGETAGNPFVHPGDTIHVPYRGQGFFRSAWPILLSTVTAATAILLANPRD